MSDVHLIYASGVDPSGATLDRVMCNRVFNANARGQDTTRQTQKTTCRQCVAAPLTQAVLLAPFQRGRA